MNLQRGLIGHWTMDDSDISNGTLYDRSGYSHNAPVPSNVSTGVSSPLGQGFSFDETNDSDRIDVIGSTAIRDAFVNNSYSISFWIKPISEDESGNWPNIFANGGDNWRIEYPGDGVGDIKMYDSNASDSNLFMARIGGTDIGSWQHVAFTVSKSGTSSSIKSYKNGDIQRNNDKGDLDADGGNDFYIHAADWVTHDLSSIRFYNRQISDAEVNALYQMREQQHHNI